MIGTTPSLKTYFERLSNDDTDNILSLTKCVSELVLAHTQSIIAQTITG